MALRFATAGLWRVVVCCAASSCGAVFQFPPTAVIRRAPCCNRDGSKGTVIMLPSARWNGQTL